MIILKGIYCLISFEIMAKLYTQCVICCYLIANRKHYSQSSKSMCSKILDSRKYGLGSLRKTPHLGHSTSRPRSLVRQSALIPTTSQPTENTRKKKQSWFQNFRQNNQYFYYIFKKYQNRNVSGCIVGLRPIVRLWYSQLHAWHLPSTSLKQCKTTLPLVERIGMRKITISIT